MLVFGWTFALLLRICGMFERDVAAVSLGIILLVVTAAVLIAALVLTSRDLTNEQRAARRCSTLMSTLPTEPSMSSTLDIEEHASRGDDQINDMIPIDIEKEIQSGSMTEA
jgi:hypothetical protein